MSRQRWAPDDEGPRIFPTGAAKADDRGGIGALVLWINHRITRVRRGEADAADGLRLVADAMRARLDKPDR
ncbi:hypothetical protein [Methylobrevis albus]|uniref:Uncharacterized protein n=1 Tax=Methylobrevis albus TaxID=2793297 RepID=A0A931N0I8_9HYPH|nr:hypothetical protein [Methylobrevis albus]MBH0238841.1 hypothetical protein [Methylobrevis albus]